MQEIRLCVTYIELDFDPTKRVQNFGGGSGPAGGGRQALASKSINLWQTESDLDGGMVIQTFSTARPVKKTVDSAGSHDVSWF
jgi:hypothetical protein